MNGCVVANGYLYVTGRLTALNYAPIAPDGSLGTFRHQTLPLAPEDFNSLATSGGVLYLLGDDDTSTPGMTAYGRIAADGSVAWTAGPSFASRGSGNNPLVMTDQGSAYILGGAYAGAFSGKTFYSKLEADGNFGTWNDSTSLPDPGGQGYRNGCAIYAGGYVYVVDGSRNEDPSVFVSAVDGDGILSNWATTSPIPPPGSLQSAGCVLGSNGYVYLAGGIDQSTDQAVNTFYYARCNSL